MINAYCAIFSWVTMENIGDTAILGIIEIAIGTS